MNKYNRTKTEMFFVFLSIYNCLIISVSNYLSAMNEILKFRIYLLQQLPYFVQSYAINITMNGKEVCNYNQKNKHENSKRKQKY